MLEPTLQQLRFDIMTVEPIRLSVAAPAYNEEASIARTIESWFNFLRKTSVISEFEIVICNDGSRDQTGALLQTIAGQNRELRVVEFIRNQGAAAALTAAIKATRFEWVMLIDSDGQFPIENILLLIGGLRHPDTRAVIGTRQKNDSWFTRFGTWSSSTVCNFIYGTRIRDFNSACKLVYGPLLRSLNLEAKGMNYSTEVTARLLECHVVIAEVRIEHRPRTAGTSNMRAFRGTIDRLLFVCYLAFRNLLLWLGVLRQPIG